MYDILRRKNKGLKDQVIEFAQRLVQEPSPSFEEAKVANLIQKQMEILGYEKVFRDDFGNVVGMMLGREADPTILLNCHMDTTSPGDEKQWDRAYCSGEIKEGKLHGRGASDCKAGLAAQVFAGALLKQSLLPLRGNLVVAATVAEEAGGSVGVRGLTEKTLPQLELRPTYAVLGEPTELGLYYGHDGWLELAIKVEGANMFDVDDAAKAIFEEFNSSIKRKNRPNQPEGLSVEPPFYDFPVGIRRAFIRLNRRLSESEHADTVLDQVKHEAMLAVQVGGTVAVDVTVRKETQKMYTGKTTIVQKVTNAWSIDPFHELMERSRHALTAAGCAVRPGKWRLGRIGMATAGGVLTNDYGIPVIGYGPGCEDVIHAPNEYVEVNRIIEAVYGTAAIVHSLIGVPVFGWTSDDI